jgi:multimeric flavodoxin WrbA
MRIAGISFSYSEDSMGYRGLTLMDHYLQFDSITMIDLPLCNSNKPDGNVPDSVNQLCDTLEQADVIVFSIPEATGHYGAAFKNAMDWLVVKANFNADLGQRYAFANKPMFVITFTPCFETDNAGDRHFEMTSHLLKDKMGANLRTMFVKHDGWKNVIPDNYNFVHDECQEILQAVPMATNSYKQSMTSYVGGWTKDYNEWNTKWKN